MTNRRPHVSFAEIKSKVSLPEVLEVLGIKDRFQWNADHTRARGVCPLPQHAHNAHTPNAEQFRIDLKDGVWLWHCFGDCQEGGDVIAFVKKMKGCSDSHVRFFFAEHWGSRLTLTKPRGKKTAAPAEAVESATNDTAPEQPHEGACPKAVSLLTPATLPSQKPAVESLSPLRFFLQLDPDVPYLLNERKLKPETIRAFGAGLCRKGTFQGYVCVPIFMYPHTPGENPVAYVARYPSEEWDASAGFPRYRLPEQFPKSRVVFNLHRAMEDPPGPIVVVEGVFSVMRLFEAGFLRAVALLGSSLSDEQTALLVGTGRPLVLLLDGDEAGINGARMAAGKLITKTWVRAIRLPSGTQPDELSDGQLQEFLSFLL